MRWPASSPSATSGTAWTRWTRRRASDALGVVAHSADHAGWQDGMNAPRLVSHLGDAQVDAGARVGEGRGFADAEQDVQPADHRVECVAHGGVQVRIEP